MWKNFSFPRKITFRGAGLLIRCYFQLLIKRSDWETAWKLTVGIGLALLLNIRKHTDAPKWIRDTIQLIVKSDG
jgi:hypothetical protein